MLFWANFGCEQQRTVSFPRCYRHRTYQCITLTRIMSNQLTSCLHQLFQLQSSDLTGNSCDLRIAGNIREQFCDNFKTFLGVVNEMLGPSDKQNLCVRQAFVTCSDDHGVRLWHFLVNRWLLPWCHICCFWVTTSSEVNWQSTKHQRA